MPQQESLRLSARRSDPLAGLRRRVARLGRTAPAPVARGMDLLLDSLAAGLDLLDQPLVLPRVPEGLEDWPELLAFLVELRRRLDEAQADQARTACHYPGHSQLEQRFSTLRQAHVNCLLLAEIMIELIAAGDEFHTPEGYLERCGEILLSELGADIAVCRLRRQRGDAGPVWENVAVSTKGNRPTPLFVKDLLETQPGHPVMRAVQGDSLRLFVITNSLPEPAPGCEPYDCVPYEVGYRSRLALLLRGATGAAFGMVILYAARPEFFNRYDCALLSDGARVVALIVGRLMALGRDTLAKAAGGMAHVGNNVLATMLVRTEAMQAELEALAAAGADSAGLAEHLDAMLADIRRLARAITRLEQAVEHPVLMHYVSGRHVLDLEPERSGGREGGVE